MDMSKPLFRFVANSSDPLDQSGVASWSYIIDGKSREVILDFPTFIVAHMINELIIRTYDIGKADGEKEVKEKIRELL